MKREFRFDAVITVSMMTDRSASVPKRVLLRRYIARALLRRLEERGLTCLETAARELEIHRNTLQRYVSGKRPVPGEVLAKLDLVDLSGVLQKKERAA